MDGFDMAAYLRRIGFAGPPRGDLAGIAALIDHQTRHVPFENLDPLAGRPVEISPAAVVDKIIHRHRGGYCYEVNGLFSLVLDALGVPHRLVACRPMTAPGRRPRTHMAILATLEGEEWLCETGFGAYGPRQPLRLHGQGPVRQGGETVDLRWLGADEFQVSTLVDGRWAPQYSFDLATHERDDFIPANWYNATHPESLFTQSLFVVRHGDGERHILFRDTYKIFRDGLTSARKVDAVESADLLAGVFGLPSTLSARVQ